jgi:leucyl aminopeptidase (aminopeptidase T)
LNKRRKKTTKRTVRKTAPSPKNTQVPYSRLVRSARQAATNCLGIAPEETVLILTDGKVERIARAFFDATTQLGARSLLLEMPPLERDGQEPPLRVGAFLKQFHAAIIPTEHSLSHTQARRMACKEGVRIATLPGIEENTMVRTLTANYEKIAVASRKLASYLTKAREVALSTALGTEISMSISGRMAHADTGLLTRPGEFSNLPAGEAYVAPVESTANGTVVVDGSMIGGWPLSQPIKLIVEEGYVTAIRGGKEARALKRLLDPLGKPAFNIAELGIGTNYKAKIVGSVLEDEKVKGTVHIALGDNISMGGRISVESHVDGILMKPTLSLDGMPILREGRWVFK